MDNLGKNLPSDAKQRDTTIVIAVTSITLSLMEGGYSRIFELLRNSSSSPASENKVVQRLNKNRQPSLEQFTRQCVLTSCLVRFQVF